MEPDELTAETATTARAVDDAIPANHLLRISRGFTAIFWGIPIALLLFSRIPLFHWRGFTVPSYLLGVLVLAIGAVRLLGAGELTRTWRRHVRRLLLALVLQAYFSPFVHWWRHQPLQPLYVLNMVVLAFSTMWLLLLVSQLGLEVSEAFDDRALRLEAEACGWSVILLLALPVAILIVYPIHLAIRHHTSFFLELIYLLQQIPGWLTIFSLLPFTLTMAVAWKAKERCLRILQARGGIVYAES